MKKLLIGAALLALLASNADAQVGGHGLSLCAPNSLSVSTTSSNVALATCGPDLYLMNTTSQEAFYQIGTSSTLTANTTVTQSYSLPGGAYQHIIIPYLSGTYYLAAVTATSVTTIRILQGSQQ